MFFPLCILELACFQIYQMRALLILMTEEFEQGAPGFAKQGNGKYIRAQDARTDICCISQGKRKDISVCT